jgi:hypothetical protein
MEVWLHTNNNGLNALTASEDGSILPHDLGPWTRVRPVNLTGVDADEQEAIALIGLHGFCCFD